MRIEVKLADRNDGYIIKNMYPLYLHDLAGVHHTLPNRYGIFEDGPVKTLMEQYDIQQIWFEHPGVLFPYLILADDIPAGFCLIASSGYVPEGTAFMVYETFILSPYRGSTVSYHALLDIFSRHQGKWTFFTASTKNNARVIAFWHKTVGAYTHGKYRTEEKMIDAMPKQVFYFAN